MSITQRYNLQRTGAGLNPRDYVPNRRSIVIDDFINIHVTQSGQTYFADNCGEFFNVVSSFAFAIPIPYRSTEGPYFMRYHWTTEQNDTGTVEMDFGLLTLGDGDSLSGATLTYTTVTDTATATDDFRTSPWSSALTVTGTEANGDVMWVSAVRDHASDTFPAASVVSVLRFEFSYIANDLRGPDPT